MSPASPVARSVSGTFWLLGFVPALVWTGLTLYLAVRGRFHAWVSPFLVAGAGAATMFVYVVLRTFREEMILEMPVNVDDWRIRLSEQLALAAFFVLILVGLYLILRVAYRMEFRTQEKLLEIEYRLAELAEKVKGDSKS